MTRRDLTRILWAIPLWLTACKPDWWTETDETLSVSVPERVFIRTPLILQWKPSYQPVSISYSLDGETFTSIKKKFWGGKLTWQVPDVSFYRNSFIFLRFSNLNGLEVRTEKRPLNWGLTLFFSDYPMLQKADIPTLVYDSYIGSVYVYKKADDDSYVALSSSCTHLGCTVDATQEGFSCPCHNSMFTKEGAVVQGPAESPLENYTVEEIPNVGLILKKK